MPAVGPPKQTDDDLLAQLAVPAPPQPWDKLTSIGQPYGLSGVAVGRLLSANTLRGHGVQGWSQTTYFDKKMPDGHLVSLPSTIWNTARVSALIEAYGYRPDPKKKKLPKILIPVDLPESKLQSVELDGAQARRHVEALTGSPDTPMTWVTYDDRTRKAGRVLHGSLRDCWWDLREDNQQGRAITMVVNETDGKGSADQNVTRARATFADDDDGTFKPDREPSLVISTSPGKKQYYWILAQPSPEIGAWASAQREVARKADPAVVNPGRAMRLAGTFHWKTGRPHLVRVEATSPARYPAPEKVVKKKKRSPGSEAQADLQTAWRYVDQVEREGGSTTYRVACLLALDFNLPDDEALGLLGRWSQDYPRPWSTKKLRQTLTCARRYGRAKPGAKVPARRGPVRLRTDVALKILSTPHPSSVSVPADRVTAFDHLHVAVLQAVLDLAGDPWDPETCYVTMKKVAARLGVSPMTVCRKVAELKASRWVRVRYVAHATMEGWVNSRYDLRPLLAALGLVPPGPVREVHAVDAVVVVSPAAYVRRHLPQGFSLDVGLPVIPPSPVDHFY